MPRARLLLAGVVAALVAAAATAPAALAGRVQYAVPSGSGYTVTAEGHGNGIVKVTITQCLVAGQAFTLPLSVTAQAPDKGTPSATWKVMQDGGAALAFTPATVQFTQPTQTATLAITAGAPSDKGAFLRFKLAPEPGSGLGEGPGYQVRFACVLAPGGAQPQLGCPSSQARAKGGNGQGNGGQGNGNGGPTDNGAPGAGNANGNVHGQSGAPTVFDDPVCPIPPPPVTQPKTPTKNTITTRSLRRATCIAAPKTLRVVAGEHSTVRVVVRNVGVNISGALVRLTTPDGQITKRTNRLGVVVFHVHPSKAGRLTVRSDVCFGVSRLAVLAAHRVVARRSPAFTG